MRKPIEGKDLLTMYPSIACEWDFGNNQGYVPSDFSFGSSFEASWICPNGHQYVCSINARTTHNRGCPRCKQRLKTSFPEQALYFYIKKAFPDAINRDRKSLGHGLELDVYVPSIGMAVEYDGAKWHTDNTLDREREKYRFCKEKGIRLIRVKENRNHWREDLEISDYIVRCVVSRKDYFYLSYAIKNVLGILGDFDFAEFFSVRRYSELFDSQSWLIDNNKDTYTIMLPDLKSATFGIEWPFSGPKIKTDVDVNRDRKRILESYYEAINSNNLLKVYPDIAKEWHPTNNGALKPEMFPPVSGEKVWWLCPKGHSYEASIAERTSRNDGCPFCYGRYAIKGENDLMTLYPDLMKEWDWTENTKRGLDPSNLKPRSDVVVHWVCSNCGRKWSAPIKSRTRGHGCRKCSAKTMKHPTARIVYVYDKDMSFLAEYCSIAEASRKTGVASSCILRACKHNYHPFQKGYFFSYFRV